MEAVKRMLALHHLLQIELGAVTAFGLVIFWRTYALPNQWQTN